MDLPLPPVRPGEVRIEVEAVSFNPVDCQIRRGAPESKAARSMILGRDLSGRVQAAHEDVTGFEVGDEVYSYVATLASSGTYAEYVSVPAELVARKPVSLSHAEAAAVPVAAITAMMALDRAGLDAAKSLFVAGGAGGVGTFSLQLAKLLGARNRVATAGSPASRAHLAEHCGLHPDQIVDYKDADFIARAVERNGGPFEVTLDLVGGRMLSACCSLVAVDGHVTSVTEAPGGDDFEILFGRNATFHPVGANAYSLGDDRRSWRRYRGMLDRLSGYFDGGKLPAPRIRVLGRLSTQVVAEAHALLESNAVQGKLVMTR